jgi:hypothetical protein
MSVRPQFLDGLGNPVTNPVVRQRLFIDPGVFSNSPTSYAYQVYDEAGAIIDAAGTVTAPSEAYYDVYDAEVGYTLRLGSIASNGLPSVEALSFNTAAVADVSFTKPVLTRTTSSGTLPMGFQIVLPSTVLAGDNIHLQVASDSTFADAAILQDVYHTLSEPDLQAPFTPDWTDATPQGLTAPGATDYLRVWVEAVTPQGRVIVSPVSDPISPTDAMVPVMLNASDKTAGMALSNGNLTGTITGGFQSARANRGSSTQKFYFEARQDFASGSSLVGVGDATVSFANWIGASDSRGAMVRNDSEVMANGAESGGGFMWGAGNIIGVACDPVNKLVWWAKDGIWQMGGNPAAGTGGKSASGATGQLIPAFQGNYGSNEAMTFNFGASAFAYTPPAGFGAIP